MISAWYSLFSITSINVIFSYEIYDVRFEDSENLYCGILYYDTVYFDKLLHLPIKTEEKATGFYENIGYHLWDYTCHNLQAHNVYV
jgi:hypothetical protein